MKLKYPRDKQIVHHVGLKKKDLASRGRFIRTDGQIVGKKANGDATKLYREAIADDIYPISNDIGVGILSFNRLGSLQRLVESIRRYTDLSKTTIFISDESSDHNVKDWLAQQKDVVVISNNKRLGVAGNSNRLIRCLSRFKYKLLLNDDVEIMHSGWESFYPMAMKKTGLHHFCYRQNGIYGATNLDVNKWDKNDVIINTITKKPHGSVMAFDDVAFNAVGYFDEQFGQYGMEHIDWSMRVVLADLQKPGFHDVQGSDKYFKIWNEESAINNKNELLSDSKAIFAKLIGDKSRVYVEATSNSDVNMVSYVIPCRVFGNRKESILTVVNNIKAQKFPNINIILVEQDNTSKFDVIPSIKHVLLKNDITDEFSKTSSFNVGVMKYGSNINILHDADILVPSWYTANMFNEMRNHDSCHLGKQVVYLTPQSTRIVNEHKKLLDTNECEHAVDYFEGGSLAITKDAFIKVGGFDEKFVSYGCEDCEFYERIKECTRFNNNRYVKMVHLWHDRQPGWEIAHKRNRDYLFSTKGTMSIEEKCNMLRALLKKRYL